MKIRSYQAADKPAVIDLWMRCGLVVPWNDPSKDIERKLSVGADLFLVGQRKDELIATVMGGYEGHRGWVNYLAVVPNEQGKGYARQMMSKLEWRLLVDGLRKWHAANKNCQHSVIRFYEALGYKADACVSLGKRLIPD